MRKAKAHLVLNLVREIKDKKKDFFKYVSSKRKTRENVGPLLNETDAALTEDTEQAVTECFFLLQSLLLMLPLRNPRPWR